MTETDYDEMVAELAIETEIFESAIWTIKFTLDAEKTTDAEKLKQIQTVVSGAFKRFEQEVKQ